jgi:hypothetical protein
MMMSRVIVVGIDVVRLGDVLSTIVVCDVMAGFVDVVSRGVVAGHIAVDRDLAGAFENAHVRHTLVLGDPGLTSIRRNEVRRDRDVRSIAWRTRELRDLWVSAELLQRVGAL